MTEDLGWARTAPARAAREALLLGVFDPLVGLYTRREVRGHEHLEGLAGPVLFVANHASHVDTPAVLRALPPAWRRRTAVAAAADYFYASAVRAAAVSLAFGTVPVARGAEASGGGGAPGVERLVAAGWSVVVFAEGTRSRDGTVGRLHSGAAVLAAEHRIPIVPVFVGGTHAVMPAGRRWMHRAPGLPVLGARHPVAVRFGAPVVPGPGEHRTDVMERVRQFYAACGAQTTPDKRIVARARRAADSSQAS